MEENDKKFSVEPCRVGEREKVLKKWFEQVKSDFLKKPDSRVLIDRNQFRLIETARDFSKILKQFQRHFRLIEK